MKILIDFLSLPGSFFIAFILNKNVNRLDWPDSDAVVGVSMVFWFVFLYGIFGLAYYVF